MLDRRGFLSGMVGALAAPALVRAGSLMPLRGEVFLSGWQVNDVVLALRDRAYPRRAPMLIDIGTRSDLASPTPPDIMAMMSKAVVRLVRDHVETTPGRYVFEASRVARHFMEVQAMRDQCVLLRSLAAVTQFRGIPIEMIA